MLSSSHPSRPFIIPPSQTTLSSQLSPVHLNHHLSMSNPHNNFFTADRSVNGVGLSAALFSLLPAAQLEGHDTISFRVEV